MHRTPQVSSSQGPKGNTGDPETSSPDRHHSDLNCAAPRPLPCVCVCVCVCAWKEGSCVEGPPEQVQADEGVRCLVGGSGSHPCQGWRAGTGCAGVALSSPRFISSPVGGCHCVPGAGLCTLRSVSDLGAAGREGGRTLRMAGRGCDVSGPSAGHSLYRNQPMKSGNDWRNLDSPALQSCACAPSPRRATLDPEREWPHAGLRKQGLELAWEGLLHRPGPSTGSWFTGPGMRTRSPRSQSPRVRRLGWEMCVHGARAVLGHPGRSPRGLVWGQEQRLRALGCGLQGGRGPDVGSWPWLLGEALG